MDGKTFKILAVDDNIKNIQVVGSILKESNHIVGFAFDGNQAINLLNNSSDYDLILLDINMPGLNGYDTCKEIRKIKDYKDVPIIFLTALSETENLVRGFEAGGQDYITKPFNAQELMARVQTHIELKYSKEQLKDANKILEKRVEKRTEQLQKANNELQRANEELQNLDQVKADFLKLISHEINTPLNGIIGFTNILKEELVDHKFYKMLDYLDSSAKRLERFSRLSLLVTEFRTNKRTVLPALVETLPIVNEILDLLKKNIEDKNIRIVKKLYATHFYADPSLIKLCIERMITNAVRYTFSGSTVTILAEQMDNSVLLQFIDEGIGFPSKILENPFRLFNVGLEHLDEDKGISLALTKLIMDAHNGKIVIGNNKNPKGAKVGLFFPNKESY
ncbi:response regulator [Maribellus comscasis]|uniref:histidine kinase n=1 Tax=Maribellus comscasis TaxID=2681766 RepID=A0A6I6K599_9BACT|nr:hybrid sensor histidine kinase/response regulator [Maribellus comscasis]QGY47612.1 response regulator [Maribellus comscasis]